MFHESYPIASEEATITVMIIVNATVQLNQGKTTSIQTLPASKSFLIVEIGSSRSHVKKYSLKRDGGQILTQLTKRSVLQNLPVEYIYLGTTMETFLPLNKNLKPHIVRVNINKDAK